jgi:glycosyltransferase involved in cell wall biosynthesis
MTPTLPSLIAKRSPVPFILGPLNGNLPWPSAFQSEQKREREWLSRFRQAYKWLPFYRSTYHHAQAILAAFDHTFNDLPHSAQAKAINFPEVGIDPELFSFPVRPVPQQLTFLYVGRLVPYKMPEVVVQAFAHSPVLQQHRLIIVGEGPERSRLETLITAAQLEHCVTLTGQVPQAEVGNLMRQADVFAFPSIRELGAGVVIEAMASGLACVVVDYGGPATLIQPDRGITIPLSHPAQLTDHFRQTLEDLAQQPDRVRQLGLAAYQHAIQYYTWQVKAEKMMQIYEWVLHRRPAKPNFWQANPILPTPSPWVNS